ncbi:MAG: hypothetical protein Q9174_007316, partial [Haloplaca sp. 1 TL-2023]
PPAARTFNPYGANGRIVPNHRGNHRPQHHHRQHNQSTPPKVNGISLGSGFEPNGSSSTPERPPTADGPIENVQKPQLMTPANPTALLKPASATNGSPDRSNGPVVNTESPQGPASSAMRPEKARYSPRITPRFPPATQEPEPQYILRSGQPREATRGRGKLWVP